MSNPYDLVDEVTKISLKKELKSGIVKVPKGTRDLTPSLTSLRNHLFNLITSVFKQHGAEEIDTPVFELKETLVNKYGEDSKLIYDLADQGGELLALRYDLTVPLARYVSMNKINCIKRFHIAKVYRRDNPAMTRGRFREFYQCDFDICGHYDPILPDIECCKVVCEILCKLELGDFCARVNHRKILDGYMKFCGVPDNLMRSISSSIDKLDKIPWESVRDEMIIEKGLSEHVVDKIEKFINMSGRSELINQLLDDGECKEAIFVEGLQEMKIFFDYAKALNIYDYLKFDLCLARGLDYYTGAIFEFAICSQSSGLNVGSIAGGGRYDSLIGIFDKNGKKIPAVGVSIGVERLMSILEEKYFNQKKKLKTKDVKVLVSSESFDLLMYRLKVAQILWDADIATEIRYKSKGKFLRDFQYCEEHQIPLCVILGEEESKNLFVTLKDMSSRVQRKIPLEILAEEVRKLI